MIFAAKPLAAWFAVLFAFVSFAHGDEVRKQRFGFLNRPPAPENAGAELESKLRKSLRDEISALWGGEPKVPVAAATLKRLLVRLERLPSDNSPLDPTQQAIANVYRTDPTRGQLIGLSTELLLRDLTKRFGGERKDQFGQAVPLFRALGIPEDVSSWRISVDQAIERFSDQGLEKQIELGEEAARAIWAVAERAGDQWPDMARKIDPFTFVWAFQRDEEFRPEVWPNRMRSAVEPHQPDYLRAYAFDHMPLPLKLTRPLDDSPTENLAFQIGFAIRNDQNSSGKLTPVQIAAVNLAGRTRSLYFAPDIKSLLDRTENPELRRAAQAALQACTRPMAEVTADPETESGLALDVARIDEIFAAWKSSPEGTPQREQLRTLIGLDYGEDRAAWLQWWERDQQSRKMCRDGERKFLYKGRVLDDRGRPIPGATVSVSVAGEFSYHRYGGPIVGWVDTDREGRYLIRCGFSTYNRDQRGIFSAALQINKPGYHFLASTGVLRRYFTEFDLRDETLIEIAPDAIVHPRSAVDIDVLLRPAAQVEVTVVNVAGEPIKPLNLQAKWTESHPEEASPVGYCGCCDETWASDSFTPETAERNQPRSVYLQASAPGLRPVEVRTSGIPNQEYGTDPAVSFYFSQFRPGVSRRFALFATSKTKDPSAVSNAVTLPTAGRYQVKLIWDPMALPEQQLRAEVTSLR